MLTDPSEAFAPLSSSQDTLATYKNPFGFSLQVIEAATQITLASGGTDVAQVGVRIFSRSYLYIIILA